jgi:serine/threonine protein kinase
VRDKYTLTRMLGAGNHGQVYLADHADLPLEFAIKQIPKASVSHRDQLIEEARRHASLPLHENVVQVYDAGDWDDDLIFIAAEPCLGGTLEDLCATPMDPAEACALISDLCRGLAHVHHHGLLHLDIRPANILLSKSGVPKLTDFGLSRWVSDPAVDSMYWPHAAPELYEHGEGTEVSDVFATAMTLAHLLSAGAICRPFPTGVDLVQACADGEWPDLDALGPNVPKKLRKVIREATTYNVNERTPSIEIFKRNLDKATPAVSFGCAGVNYLTTIDGEWSIEVREGPGRLRVEVKRRGRRQGALGRDDLTETEARRCVAGLVTDFAYPKAGGRR